MKTQIRAIVPIAVAVLASSVLAPAADLKAAEKSEHLVAQAQAGGPTMTPGLHIITEPNPSFPIKHDAIIKAGIVQSQYGRRVRGQLILDLLSRDT